ncbi:DUF317 domain-containing protein [Streptomyces viridochromogenes]|uniref:DUF317 domain-containing protein n=1 Tax=Streptomyces viridochromogenes Tue57 TaxID=1160705 RepID=L8PIR6_STRVR|nr:DUF317 domain-containing protein [Streptomyces viridochromogenes]ELS55918.1 hypothetical protein STVIR_3263 [Streptomyces viridochromogenes Tue57]
MPHPEADPHLRLDLLDGRPGAVSATITGTPTHTMRALLAVHGFEPLDDSTMVMARIDCEEAHYADQAAHALRAEGVTVDITPQLREEIDTEWTWANYPMPWCSREEIRKVSGDAQHIYDDIRHGRLIIHAHAHDGWTTVAVGTYRDGPSIHLHGENHLRVEVGRYDTPAKAIAEFERLYGDAVRPGPAPTTRTERDAEQARTPSGPAAAGAESLPTTAEPVAEQAAEADDHEALLKDFLESHTEWEKWRTWEDFTTVANHESLTLRAIFDHDAEGRETKWTFASYETPVSDRLWHGTATASTSTAIVSALLDAVATEHAWGRSLSTSATETAITEAISPLTDSQWKHTIDGRYITWEAPGAHEGGVQFDAFAAQKTDSPLPAWTIWGGHAVHQPTWALQLSANAPAALVQSVTFEMAEGQGTRLVRHAMPDSPARRTTQAPAPVTVPPPAAQPPGRSR